MLRVVRLTLALALALALAAACSDPTPPPGGPCSRQFPCEPGLVCMLDDPNLLGSEGTCIEADGDIDGDGIRNDRDFCHDRPGGEYDEDGDGVGDICDRCPIALPPSDPDPDGDDVDAPCDPDIHEPGDRIVLFEGFNAPLAPTWKATAGWELRGGEIVLTTTDPTALETLVAPLPLTTSRMAVLAQYRIDRADAAAVQNFAGVIAIDRRPAGVAAVTCGGARAGEVESLLLDTDTGASAMPLEGLFESAGRYRVAQRLEGIQAGCAMIADNAIGAVSATTGGETPTEAGIVGKGVTARFQYVLAVQRPQ